MLTNKLISIIIPTFNRGDLIGQTLNSIINQNYTNWECLIVDDGSIDSTKELMAKYTETDKRFQYHLRPSNRIKGANSCRNYGFELSKGDYIKWFDSDDIMHPDFLERQIEMLSKNEDLSFCASFSETFVDQIENVVGLNNPEIYNLENSLYNYIIGKLIFLTPSPLWKRDFLNNKNLFDETLSNAQETDFNFARLSEGAKFKYISEALFYVRRGHSSIDGNSGANIDNFLSLFKYYQKVFVYLKSESTLLNKREREMLIKFVLFKELMTLTNLRQNFSVSHYWNEIKRVVINTFQIELKPIKKIKILIGILLLISLKKGYRFFNTEELKAAKNYHALN
jgi:glycosyltransferase involved in cell wall biosynthesis